MLEQEGIYNDLSPKLREKLEALLDSFGKRVRYKFKLERRNPDPEKYNGAIIYPSQYNLDPVTFKVTDQYEDRIKDGKQKVKNIGIIENVEKDDRGNNQYRFSRIRVIDTDKGIKDYDLENEDDRAKVAYLELHPKNGGGLFPNKQMVSMITRIDETKLANDKRTERSARKKAMDIAENMSDREIVDFADGMATPEWDSTQEIIFLRNKIEELAETSPIMFNEKVKSKKMEIQTTLKRAIDNHILSSNPMEGTLAWAATNQVIISLGTSMGDKNEIERYADWVLDSGDKGDKAYKKIESLLKKPVTV